MNRNRNTPPSAQVQDGTAGPAALMRTMRSIAVLANAASDVMDVLREGGEPASDAAHEAKVFSLDARATNFAEYTMAELRMAHDAFQMIGNIVTSVSYQPRFSGSEPHTLNRAGLILSDLDELTAVIESAIRDEAEARTPKTRAEAEDQAWLILTREIEDGWSLSDVADIAVKAAFSASSLREKEASA